MCSVGERYSIPCEVSIEEISATLFEPRELDDGGTGEYNIWLDWAILSQVRLKFYFGKRVRSKTINYKFAQFTPCTMDRPSDEQLDAALKVCLAGLREECQAHGFDPGELTTELKEEKEQWELIPNSHF